ncbi:hypothetical protein [Stutzerimonas chloritidismutans]|uniref:hypothetical protein n=1 Tax=Stutzerimonas chloritidismutans TaxID=203192 RepID=UPI0003FCB753|nr:hypothetical protein [Stutzerimonas chloritidismutans]
MDLPENLLKVKASVQRAISPIKPATSTPSPSSILLSGQRTNAGRSLPPYYLTYFLLVDLLGFKNLGQFEKLAWSVPIEYLGRKYLIEHRKMGLGIFAEKAEAQEIQAQEIANKIRKAARIAKPYFEWRAKEAIANSSINVRNVTGELHQRFQYFVREYESAYTQQKKEIEHRSMASWEDMKNLNSGYFSQPFTIFQKVRWLANSAIDAFFSFTEHVFIHLAIIQGRIKTGNEVAELVASDWSIKYKSAFNITEPKAKSYHDALSEIRRQHRNFVAHGSFGKRGEAFSFHSDAGAVPVLLTNTHRPLSLTGPVDIADAEAIKTISDFMEYLWADEREPARFYLQRTELPMILTLAADGTYEKAMQSVEEMEQLVDYLEHIADQAANMDW